MKKFLGLLLFSMLFMNVQAQFFHSKYSISIGKTSGSFPGSGMINDDSFIVPSLFRNYHSSSGFSFKTMSNNKKNLSFGMQYGIRTGTDWKWGRYSDYVNSVSQIHSFSPLMRFHNRFKDTGLFNRIQLFIEGGPSIGLVRLNLNEPLFEIVHTGNDHLQPFYESTVFAGLNLAAGIEFTLTQVIGCFINYEIDVNRLSSSKFYSDQSFMHSQLNAGLILKLKKDKYFYY
jgi:hypothetical protein